MSMKAIDARGVKVYDLCVGKTLPQWLSERAKRSLRKDADYRRRIELVQDFYFNTASQRIQVSKDGNYIFATGTYPPMVKCYDVRELSLKFERHLDAETVQFQMLSDDYSKVVFLGNDRTLSFHAAFGFHYKLRVPKFGRDLAFNPEQCDLYVASSSPELYRVNLDLGRFMEPIDTKCTGNNVVDYISTLQLLVAGSENGSVGCWDVRAKPQRVSVLNVLDGDHEVSAIKHDSANGLSLAVGTSDGRCAIYDLRSSKPVIVKEHQHGFPIINVEFQHPGDLVLSADKKVVKIWNRSNGNPFTTIEAQADMNDICLVRREPEINTEASNANTSGLLLATGESDRVMSFYVPKLGPAPLWSSFLDNLTEELEESNENEEDLYENYKFVPRTELETLGVTHLVGTPMLRAYMHGYFMDMKLYQRIKAVSEPQAFEDWRKKKIKEKIEEKNAQRIKPKKKLPKVNKALAQRKDTNLDVTDSRFSALFNDPDFEVDQESERFKQVYPSGYGKSKESMDQVENDDDDEEEEAESSADDDSSSVEEPKPLQKSRSKSQEVTNTNRKKRLKVEGSNQDIDGSRIVDNKLSKEERKKKKKENKPVWKRLKDGEEVDNLNTKLLGAGNVELSFVPKS